MRIIPKYQSGGRTVTAKYQPLERPLASLTMAAFAASTGSTEAQAKSSDSATSSSSSGGSGLMSEDMIKQIYSNGLPSDVQAFVSKMNKFGGGLGEFGLGSSSTQYSQLMGLLPSIKMNKELFTKAFEHAQSKNTISEPAISSDGRVFVATGNGIQMKTVGELDDEERPLTVGEIASYRANSKSAAFDSGNLINAISNSVSSADVFKSISDIVDKIGSTETENEVIGKKSGNKITEGLQQLLKEAEDGTYKIHTERKTQTDKAAYVLNYILQTLTPNQRTLLQVYARQNGLDTGTGPIQIIQGYIQGTLDDTLKQSIASAPNSSGSGDGSGKSGSMMDMTIPMQIMTGDGLQHSQELISFGEDAAYSVDVQTIPQLTERGGKGVIPAGSMTNLIKSEEWGIFDSQAMHIGDRLIDPTELNRLYYDGSGMKAMWLPFTTDKNGKVMPNLRLMEEYSKIMHKAADENLSPEQVNKLCRDSGLAPYYNPDGSLNTRNYRRFGVISVIGDERTFEDADEDNSFTKIDNENTRYAFSTTLGTEKKPMDIDGDLYRANMFIPIYDNPSLARAAGGNYSQVPKTTWTQDEQEYAKVQDRMNFNQPRSKSEL